MARFAAGALLALSLCASPASAGEGIEAKLQAVLDGFVAAHPDIPGVALAIHSDNLQLDWSGAAGLSDISAATAFQPDQPLRLASTTKTYVAATILRLAELEELDIDTTIDHYLPTAQQSILSQGGYDPGSISVRHLLTHTSGLFDYAMAQPYVEAVTADMQHRWTREEQLRFAMEHGQPYGSPGEVFHYSDTGYILLGEIIERRSGLPLAAALRHYLKFATLDLSSTWLETLEPQPEGVADRAHQYMGGTDFSGADPSFDLYGGGGLAASMPDLAHFYHALMSGRIFDNPDTLTLMKSPLIPWRGGAGRTNEDGSISLYCMGVSARGYRGYTVWGHGGFWGTLGAYIPAFDLGLGIAVTEQTSASEQARLRARIYDLIIDHYQP